MQMGCPSLNQLPWNCLILSELRAFPSMLLQSMPAGAILFLTAPEMPWISPGDLLTAELWILGSLCSKLRIGFN